MKRQIFIKSLFMISALLITSFCEAQSEQKNDKSQKQHFEKMADYLTMGGGKWTGENSNYNPDNPRSPKVFGLWFERPMNNLLSLKVVAYVVSGRNRINRVICGMPKVQYTMIYLRVDKTPVISCSIRQMNSTDIRSIF